MKNDDFLAEFREAPRREFADELYERINRPIVRPTLFSSLLSRRAALALGALLLLVAAGLWLSPEARAFASQQLRQIGAIRLIDAGAEPTNDAFNPEPTISAPEARTVQVASSPAEASLMAGFEVLAPVYLPTGYTSQGRWSVDVRASGVYVVSVYESPKTGHFLTLNQIRYAPNAAFEQRYGANESVQDIVVNGTAGVWITGRLMANPNHPVPDDGSQPQLLPTNWMMWETDGLTHILYGSGLEQSEMLRIAESLGR